MITECKVSRIF